MNDLPKRKKNRLNGYSYSSAGAYFITICTRDRKNILSEIAGDGSAGPKTILTDTGKIVEKYILSTNNIDNVSVDRYVIMPNHIHLILIIKPAENIVDPESDVCGTSKAPSPTDYGGLREGVETSGMTYHTNDVGLREGIGTSGAAYHANDVGLREGVETSGMTYHTNDVGLREDVGMSKVTCHANDGGLREGVGTSKATYHANDGGLREDVGTSGTACHANDGGLREDVGTSKVTCHANDGGLREGVETSGMTYHTNDVGLREDVGTSKVTCHANDGVPCEEVETSKATYHANDIIPHAVSTLKRFCSKEIGYNIFQRSFHDHIIRSRNDYNMITKYMDENPVRWQSDCFYTPSIQQQKKLT